MVKRYDLSDNRFGWVSICENKDGNYIKLSDYEKLQSKLTIAKEALIVVFNNIEYDNNCKPVGSLSGTHCSEIAKEALEKLEER